MTRACGDGGHEAATAEQLQFLLCLSAVDRESATHSFKNIPHLDNAFEGPIPSSAIPQWPLNPDLPPISTKAVTGICKIPKATSWFDIKKYLMQGRIWDAFEASPFAICDPPRSIVVKLTTPTLHDTSSAKRCYIEISREAWVYQHPLADLQGTVVPKWYGVWASKQSDYDGVSHQVLGAVLDHAGEPLTDEDVQLLTREEKLQVIQKYKLLHASGVCHFSCKPKHWIKPRGAPMSSLRLIDFGCSLVRPNVPAARDETNIRTVGLIARSVQIWEESVREEMADIKEVLGLEIEDEYGEYGDHDNYDHCDPYDDGYDY